MLSVTFKPFMKSVLMLNVVMMSVIMLNVVMLCFLMLNILAPKYWLKPESCTLKPFSIAALNILLYLKKVYLHC
jgi:hypothetical protein